VKIGLLVIGLAVLPMACAEAPNPSQGFAGRSCVSATPERRTSETLLQYQYRVCQWMGGTTCYACPDGRPGDAPRASIPQEWLP